MEYEIEKTDEFDKCLKKLRNRKAVLAIATRPDRAKLGNFGKSTQKKDIKKAKDMAKAI